MWLQLLCTHKLRHIAAMDKCQRMCTREDPCNRMYRCRDMCMPLYRACPKFECTYCLQNRTHLLGTDNYKRSRSPMRVFANDPICMYIRIYTHVCKQLVQIHMYVRVCVCVYPYIYIYICKHTYIHTYMHTCIHAYMHAYIHTDIHTHIHILTCRSSSPLSA